MRHPPMDTVHRAKIFSAFDALAGFDDCIADKEVPYCDRRCLSKGEREEINRKLAVLYQLTCNTKTARKNRPQITLQYFSPCTDENSFAYGTGGIYKTITGICQKVDPVADTLTVDEASIPVKDISSICGSLFDMPKNIS